MLSIMLGMLSNNPRLFSLCICIHLVLLMDLQTVCMGNIAEAIRARLLFLGNSKTSLNACFFYVPCLVEVIRMQLVVMSGI